jgi:heme/copper-type cytochrome/quinol oxidase subunit 4
MLAQESVRLLDQGAVQFIVFGVMIVITFIALWIAIAK